MRYALLILSSILITSCHWFGHKQSRLYTVRDSVVVHHREVVDTISGQTVSVDCDSLILALHPEYFPQGGNISKADAPVKVKCPPSVTITRYIDTSRTYFVADKRKEDSLGIAIDDMRIKSKKQTDSISSKNEQIAGDKKYKWILFAVLMLFGGKIAWDIKKLV